jgi:hypothetical protein
MILHMESVWQNWSNITDIVLGKTVPELRKSIMAKDHLKAFIGAGLAAAGFSRIRQIQSKGMFSLVEGYKI